MEFELKTQDFDLPVGYRKWFTLDEILAAEKEISLYRSKAYQTGFLKSDIFENLKGEALDKKVASLRLKVHKFTLWSNSQIPQLKQQVMRDNFTVAMDTERGVPFALVPIVNYQKRWFGLKKVAHISGESKIYLSPEWISADKKKLQKHLLDRISATEQEMLMRLSP